jgi:predicted small metal-binding protein
MRISREDAKVTPISWQYAAGRSQTGGETVKVIRCECGFVARGDSDDQVIGVIRGHLTADHPALLAAVSREDLLSWIKVE